MAAAKKKHAGGRPATGRTGKTVSLYLANDTIAIIEAVTQRKGEGAGAHLIDEIVRVLRELAQRELSSG